MPALRYLRTHPLLVRLLGVRLSSQFTDGMYQASIATALAFNPQRETEPIAIAAGFAVLLLPYSMVGPFAGALLDRWDRRTVFMVANVLRALLLVLTAVAVGSGAPSAAVLACSLGIGGATRFVAAGYSAALPHTVPRRNLVTMNAVNTTLGAAATGCGAGVALLLRQLVGAGNSGAATSLVIAAFTAVLCAGLASTFAPRALGPDRHPHARPITAIGGLREGFSAVIHARPVFAAMTALAGHRFVFGMNTLLLLLLSRNTFGSGADEGSDQDGLATFAAIGAATGVGLFAAAVITPIITRKFGRQRVVVTAALACAGTQLLLLPHELWLLYGAGFSLGLCGQVIKLSTDATMQLNIADDRRGHVFAFQDALFNVTFVAALFVAAILAPASGIAPGLVLLGATLYLLGAAASVTIARSGPHLEHGHLPATGPHPAADHKPAARPEPGPLPAPHSGG